MTTCSDLTDYEWLTGTEAATVLTDLAGNNTPLHTAIARLRKHFSATRAHLLIDQADLRRRATAKFTQAHQMFFTRVGLEQSTDEWVARYKATRFNGHPVADLCCGIGGDLQALAKNGPTIGVDRDPAIAHFAKTNSGVPVHPIDLATFDIKSAAALHIDPDRRPTGPRATSLEHCEPSLDILNELIAQVPHTAVKLAPGTDVPTDWSERCELEWISRDRECRQQVAWHGTLAQHPGQHRATILPAACGLAQPPQPRTITGRPKQQIPIAPMPAHYVFDIDPAVLAAKLKGVLAAEHNLKALSASATYLTGDSAITDPALTCFAVDEVLPFRVDKLARFLRAHNIGRLEIKKRGVDVDPEKLRRDLKLRGDICATLLITPIASKPAAILAHRLPT